MCPFLDGNPDAPPEQRYKGIVRSRVIHAVASPDGIHWSLIREEPVMTDWPFDSPNVAFWDTNRGEYVAYTRGIAGKGSFKGGVRWIRRATSKDFLNWTPLELIDPGDTPYEHLYTNACTQYFRAPHIYLMFPKRFVPDRKVNEDWGAPGHLGGRVHDPAGTASTSTVGSCRRSSGRGPTRSTGRTGT